MTAHHHIIGIGTDLIEIARIEALLNERGPRFIARTYSDAEQAQATAITNENKRLHYYAKRFAGKEAVAKALGTGIGSAIAFHEISITNNEAGAPIVSLPARFNHLRIYISLSDTDSTALAFAIAEGV